MRRLLVVLIVLAAAGCGGTTAKKLKPTRHQPIAVQHLTGKAAERVGATMCKHLPPGTLPAGDRAAKIGALRAYVQKQHPTDDVGAMLRGCTRALGL
jgi:hypothetical protein